MTLRRLACRLEKAQLGNLGVVKPVGDGVWEMREFFGPGWRMYYVMQGQTIRSDAGRWRQGFPVVRYCFCHCVVENHLKESDHGQKNQRCRTA